jgi:hypothetical protein
MAALVCLSPVLADQSFPRSPEEARTVAIALGELADRTDRGVIRIVATPGILELLEIYCWDQPAGLKGEIFAYLNQLLLAGGDRTATVRLPQDIDYLPHPLPKGCDSDDAYVQLWADDLGRLLAIHDQCIDPPAYFIGVACERAFSGRTLNVYEGQPKPRFFPLVAPETCDCNSPQAVLVDSDIFEVPPRYNTSNVTFAQAKRNAHVLGASAVVPPRRGSHYRVKFPSDRSWPLDANIDPVAPAYLQQLPAITGYPLEVIKYALIEGKLPPRRSRLARKYLM